MKRTALLLSLFALAAGAASAQTGGSPILNYSGALSAGDPTFNRPSSSSTVSDIGTAVAYDFFSFTTNSFAGEYNILADYRGAGGLPDGFLFLYASFDPAQPLNQLLAGDDDFSISGTSEFLASFLADRSSFGSGLADGHLLLAANTTYTVVVSGWANGDLGAVNVTVTAVPEPATVAIGFGAAALAAWSVHRRRAVRASA